MWDREYESVLASIRRRHLTLFPGPGLLLSWPFGRHRPLERKKEASVGLSLWPYKFVEEKWPQLERETKTLYRRLSVTELVFQLSFELFT